MSLTDLCEAISTKAPDAADIASRLSGKTYSMPGLIGIAAKHHLRLVVEEFIMTADYSVSQLCTLPETAYSTSHDTGSQIVIASTMAQREITAYDTALRMGERPVIVDIRTGAWKNISSRYFKQGRWRSVPLDDMFGEGRYDKILAVPRGQASGLMHRGVHIATLPFTNSEFFEIVDAMADTYGLVTPALEDSR